MPLRVPMVDIHTIGAGGGSIARITRAGLLQVGPQSAGADPGPIAYGRGGTAVTVTDANWCSGGSIRERLPGVGAGVAHGDDRSRDRSSRSARRWAWMRRGCGGGPGRRHQSAGHAIRLVSVEKGHDPRDFALCSPSAAPVPCTPSALARELGMPTVLVPRFPGITSALGCVLAQVRHDFVRTHRRSRSPMRDPDGIDAAFAEQRAARRKADFSRRRRAAQPRSWLCTRPICSSAARAMSFRVPVTGAGFRCG